MPTHCPLPLKTGPPELPPAAERSASGVRVRAGHAGFKTHRPSPGTCHATPRPTLAACSAGPTVDGCIDLHTQQVGAAVGVLRDLHRDGHRSVITPPASRSTCSSQLKAAHPCCTAACTRCQLPQQAQPRTSIRDTTPTVTLIVSPPTGYPTTATLSCSFGSGPKLSGVTPFLRAQQQKHKRLGATSFGQASPAGASPLADALAAPREGPGRGAVPRSAAALCIPSRTRSHRDRRSAAPHRSPLPRTARGRCTSGRHRAS